LLAGYEFYEKQSQGVGDYFLGCLAADTRSLEIYAGIHEKSGGFYRMMAKRFPFAFYYMIEDGRANVYAIVDCRRNPSWIQSHLREARRHTDD